jgi:hypothetical protein
MFFLVNVEECNKLEAKGEDFLAEHHFCTWGTSLLSMFSYYLGAGIPRTAFSSAVDTTTLSVIFCLICVMVMLNVLIAVVVDAYTSKAKPCGEQIFWRFRFEGIANAQAIGSIVTVLFYKISMGHIKEWLGKMWSKARWYYSGALPPHLRDRPYSIFLYGLQHAAITLAMVSWWLLGLVTLGLIWPPQVIDYLFCPPAQIDEVRILEIRQAKERQQQVEQFSDITTRMDHMEDTSEELRGLQLRLSKDLREVKKGFQADMAFVSKQLLEIQDLLKKRK